MIKQPRFHFGAISFFETGDLQLIECVGWWEQPGLGRQPMQDLVLDFDGSTLSGQGCDVVASFALSGSIRPDGRVEILKKYRHRHSVLYVGSYDGEGTFSGRWDIDGHQGQWLIRLLRSSLTADDDAIQEIT